MKKHTFLVWISIIALVPLLAGCGAAGGGGTDISVSDVGNVEGTVTDASTGTALSGVTVQIGDKTATTGDNGVFSIQDLDVGSRTITASKTGYQNHNGTCEISKGTTVSHNVQLTANTFSDTTPPTVSSISPASGAADVAINSSISVTFSEAMDCSTITTSSFTLKDSSNNAAAGTITTCSNTSAVFTPSSNLSYSTSYTATITSGVKDAAGNALASNSSWSFTTEAQPTTAPSAPTGVNATAGNGQVTISWDAVSGATQYSIYYCDTSGMLGRCNEINAITTNTYTHTGLTNGRPYYYQVTAQNVYGESNRSNEISGTPTSPLVISSFTTPILSPRDIAFDGTYIWAAFSRSSISKIYKFDTSGNVITSFDTPFDWPVGIAYDGTGLWVSGSNKKIYKLDDSGNIISSFDAPGIVQGLTWDGINLWMTGNETDKIFKTDIYGNVVTSFGSPNTYTWGMAFDGTYLWVINDDPDKIYKMDITGNVIASYDTPGPFPQGLAYDGSNLWYSDGSYSGTIYKLNLP